MKTFKVYKHPIYGFETVKYGFSWPAFFFGGIWMLVKKLWVSAGLFFAIYIICSLIEELTSQTQASGAQTVVYILLFLCLFSFVARSGFQGQQVARRKSFQAGLRTTEGGSS